MADIKTSRGRARLAVNADAIYWSKHAIGEYIGYRKTSADLGMRLALVSNIQPHGNFRWIRSNFGCLW